jgi:hypothetical protein
LYLLFLLCKRNFQPELITSGLEIIPAPALLRGLVETLSGNPDGVLARGVEEGKPPAD